LKGFDWAPGLIFPVSNVVGPFISVAVCGIDDIFLKIIVEPRGTVTVFGLNALSVLFCMRIVIVTGGFGVGVGVGLTGVGVGVGFLCGVGVGVTGVGVGVGVSVMVTAVDVGVPAGSFVAVCVRRDGTS
jgi:hypothetical protein